MILLKTKNIIDFRSKFSTDIEESLLYSKHFSEMIKSIWYLTDKLKYFMLQCRNYSRLVSHMFCTRFFKAVFFDSGDVIYRRIAYILLQKLSLLFHIGGKYWFLFIKLFSLSYHVLFFYWLQYWSW